MNYFTKSFYLFTYLISFMPTKSLNRKSINLFIVSYNNRTFNRFAN